MLKRSVCLMLVVLMMISAVPFTFAENAPQGVAHPVVDGWFLRYKEDFEDKAAGTALSSVTGWTQNGTTYQNSAVEVDPNNEENMVARTTRTNWRGNENYAYYSFPSALDGKVYVEMKVYLAGTRNDGETAIMIFDENKNVTSYLASFSGGVGFYNVKHDVGGAGGSHTWLNHDLDLTADTTPAWHTYGILLDYTAQSAKLVIDNIVKSDISSAVDFTNSNLGGVGINGGRWGDAVSWMHDDIRVYTEEAPSGISHPVVDGWFLRYKEDFEDEAVGTNLAKMTGWAQPSSTYQSAAVAKESEAVSNKVAKITRTGWRGNDEHIYYALPRALGGEVYAEMRIYLAETAQAGEFAIMLMDENKNIASYLSIALDGMRKINADDTQVWLNNDLRLETAPLGWHTVGVKLNYTEKTAKLVIDNVVGSDISSAIDFTNPKLGGIGINGGLWGTTTTSFADDICVYTKVDAIGADHHVVNGWYTHYDIDFEDALALRGESVNAKLGWTEQNPTQTAVDTTFEADPVNENNTALKIAHNANPNGAYENAEYVLEEALTGKFYFETRMFKDGKGAWGNITLYDKSGNKTIEVYNFDPAGENSWRYYNASGSVIWVANLNSAENTWFTLGLMLDLENQTFDIYENGIKRNSAALPLLSDNINKLSFNRYRYDSATDSSVYFDDIKVFMEKAPIPYTVLDVIMTDNGGEFVNEPVLGGSITGVKLRKRNASDSAVVFVAAYQGGKLTGVQSADITSNSAAGEQQILPVSIALPTEGEGELKVKAFVWEDRTDLVPVIEAYETKDKKITLFVAGDSITHNYNSISSYPMKGYGQVLQDYLDDEGVIVDNRGLSGRSTKSYMAEGALNAILNSASSGDYMTIQFGHNDQDSSDPLRGTTIDEYKTNLRYYVQKAKERGINPIFVVPPVRRLINENTGALYSKILGDYPEAMESVAEELGVPYIDLYTQTETLVNNMEAEEKGSSAKLYMILDANDSDFFAENTKWTSSPFYTSAKNDSTHFNKYGANVLAHMISEGLATLTDYEISKFATPDETDPETTYSAE